MTFRCLHLAERECHPWPFLGFVSSDRYNIDTMYRAIRRGLVCMFVDRYKLTLHTFQKERHQNLTEFGFLDGDCCGYGREQEGLDARELGLRKRRSWEHGLIVYTSYLRSQVTSECIAGLRSLVLLYRNRVDIKWRSLCQISSQSVCTSLNLTEEMLAASGAWNECEGLVLLERPSLGDYPVRKHTPLGLASRTSCPASGQPGHANRRPPSLVPGNMRHTMGTLERPVPRKRNRDTGQFPRPCWGLMG